MERRKVDFVVNHAAGVSARDEKVLWVKFLIYYFGPLLGNLSQKALEEFVLH